MDNLGQHDTALAIKQKSPVLVTTKVEHEKEEQQHSNYMGITESNLYIKSEEVDITLDKIDCERNAIKKEYLGSEMEEDLNGIDNLKQEDIDIDENDLKNEGEQSDSPSIPVAELLSNAGGHTLVHQNTLENITSTFETYSPVAKYTQNQGKRNSPKNKISHKVVYKCEQCSYQAMSNSRLSSHIRVHQDPSELDMYKCTQCDFETKYKNCLKQHSVRHKGGADMPRYKCNSCDFESKRKGTLRAHICLHQKTSGLYIQEQGVLKCEQCFYECTQLRLFLLHLRGHKYPSQLKKFECTQCNFKTRHRSSLKAHSILHKNAADIPSYKCNSCDFETKRRCVLIKHIRRRHNTSRHINLEKSKQ